ncbi:MAG TPA: VOC family protein [Streptosporangiaceae bacterium]|nr:VOC family protein [Streptosporangiaceae bacterium]
MANGARIGSSVMFVQNLARSVTFYREVLALEVADRSPTAALLVSGAGGQLILRSMGSGAVHPLGGVGVQYVIWTAADEADLDRCERTLKELSAHRDTRSSGQAKAVEGRDPDDIVVMIVYPGPDQVALHELPVRIYGW